METRDYYTVDSDVTLEYHLFCPPPFTCRGSVLLGRQLKALSLETELEKSKKSSHFFLHFSSIVLTLFNFFFRSHHSFSHFLFLRHRIMTFFLCSIRAVRAILSEHISRIHYVPKSVWSNFNRLWKVCDIFCHTTPTVSSPRLVSVPTLRIRQSGGGRLAPLCVHVHVCGVCAF